MHIKAKANAPGNCLAVLPGCQLTHFSLAGICVLLLAGMRAVWPPSLSVYWPGCRLGCLACKGGGLPAQTVLAGLEDWPGCPHKAAWPQVWPGCTHSAAWPGRRLAWLPTQGCLALQTGLAAHRRLPAAHTQAAWPQSLSGQHAGCLEWLGCLPAYHFPTHQRMAEKQLPCNAALLSCFLKAAL